MKKRNLSLTPRAEEVRESKSIAPPIQFSLEEILLHFSESLESIKQQFDVATQLKNDGNIEGAKHIWRSQVVLIEGLLDFYIHEMSKYCMFRIFNGDWDKTEKYKGFMIPMEKVEIGINSNNSTSWFFNYLNERFSRDVFLSVETMRDQLNLIGIGFNNVMIKAFPCDKEQQSLEKGKRIVQELFTRRNLIAHQNDRSHSDAVQNNIDEAYVEEFSNNVEAIVKAINEIAQEKNA